MFSLVWKIVMERVTKAVRYLNAVGEKVQRCMNLRFVLYYSICKFPCWWSWRNLNCESDQIMILTFSWKCRMKVWFCRHEVVLQNPPDGHKHTLYLISDAEAGDHSWSEKILIKPVKWPLASSSSSSSQQVLFKCLWARHFFPPPPILSSQLQKMSRCLPVV